MAGERVQRRLAAILAADVVGFSRLMEADEAGTLAVLKARRKEVLEPLVAGELGDRTQLDTTTYPPLVRHVDFVRDLPTEEDLIESFPVFLVSEELASVLTAANLSGFQLDDAEGRPSAEYLAVHGGVPHKRCHWLRPPPRARPTAGSTSDTDCVFQIRCMRRSAGSRSGFRREYVSSVSWMLA